MDNPTIAAWLSTRVRQELWASLLVGALSAVGCVIALGITAYLTFFTVIFTWIPIRSFFEIIGVAPSRLDIPPIWPSIATVGFIVLLFVGYPRSRREVQVSIPKVWLNTSVASPAILVASARIVTDILFSAPKLAFAARGFFRRVIGFAGLDKDRICVALTILLRNHGRVPLDALNGVTIDQIELIDGVVFVSRDPAGFSLTQELRDELTCYCAE